jgi:hypothetical protein
MPPRPPHVRGHARLSVLILFFSLLPSFEFAFVFYFLRRFIYLYVCRWLMCVCVCEVCVLRYSSFIMLECRAVKRDMPFAEASAHARGQTAPPLPLTHFLFGLHYLIRCRTQQQMVLQLPTGAAAAMAAVAGEEGMTFCGDVSPASLLGRGDLKFPCVGEMRSIEMRRCTSHYTSMFLVRSMDSSLSHFMPYLLPFCSSGLV